MFQNLLGSSSRNLWKYHVRKTVIQKEYNLLMKRNDLKPWFLTSWISLYIIDVKEKYPYCRRHRRDEWLSMRYFSKDYQVFRVCLQWCRGFRLLEALPDLIVKRCNDALCDDEFLNNGWHVKYTGFGIAIYPGNLLTAKNGLNWIPCYSRVLGKDAYITKPFKCLTGTIVQNIKITESRTLSNADRSWMIHKITNN